VRCRKRLRWGGGGAIDDICRMIVLAMRKEDRSGPSLYAFVVLCGRRRAVSFGDGDVSVRRTPRWQLPVAEMLYNHNLSSKQLHP